MDCAGTRERLLEWELGILPADVEHEVVGHVERCAACARVARAERALSAGLLRLRVDPPFRVDVSARVMAGLGRVPRRHVAWALASAVAAALALAAVLAVVAPQGRVFLAAVAAAAGWLVRSAASLAASAVPYVVSAGRFLAGLGRAALDLAEAGARLEPAARPFVLAAAATVLAASSYVIARDLRSRPAAKSLKEQP